MNPFINEHEMNKNEFILNWECIEKEQGVYYWRIKSREELTGIAFINLMFRENP